MNHWNTSLLFSDYVYSAVILFISYLNNQAQKQTFWGAFKNINWEALTKFLCKNPLERLIWDNLFTYTLLFYENNKEVVHKNFASNIRRV